MTMSVARRLRFGAFELDLHDRELRRNGLRVKLQEQPFQVLALLLERPGDLVTRERLARHLWPDLHVNFERSLNTAVNALRQSLGDSSKNPRFIETRSGLGYRFLAPVEVVLDLNGEPDAPARIDSIAVLAFEYIGSGHDMEYLTDSIAESIIFRLSAVKNLRVAARSTAFRLRGSDIDPRTAGKILNVRSVLNGRVEHRAGELVIGVELVDVNTGSQLWGERYQRPPAQIFDIEKEIATAISKRLSLPLEHENNRSVKSYGGNFEAYQNYLKGRYFFNKMSEGDLHKSIAHFEAALAEDPNYALAHTGLADTYCLFAFMGVITAREAYARALQSTMAGLRIDQDLAEAHASLASLKKLYEWDWPGAEAEYLRALELNPNYASGHQQYAAHLAAMGRNEEAIREGRRAQELDPLSLVINMELAWALYMGRDFQASVEQSWKTLAMEPRFAPAQHTLGLAYEQMGMHEEAIVELENARACSGEHPVAAAALGHAHATAGNRRESEAARSELEHMAQQRYVSPYWLSMVYAGLGEDDLAFERLSQAQADRDVWLVWLNVEPRFDRLRQDRRFDDLVRSIGFENQARVPAQV
jgi:TolB-like protein